MKKKCWIILILGVLLTLGIGLYLWLRPTLFHAEIIDPRTLHSSPAHRELIIGLWHHDGHLFYRFNEDGTGHSWDTNDDISEDEATAFCWEAYEEALMISHKLRLRGVVPRYYQIDVINAFDFRFHDAYHTYALEKVMTDSNGMVEEQKGYQQE